MIEIHEAFAGQVLSNFTAMQSDDFGKKQLGLAGRLGDIDMGKVNTRGGSLSLGHPFGATGVRLNTTACSRLHAGEGKYALVTACADAGLGHASVLERYE